MKKIEALKLLLNIDPQTVIDDDWYEYFMEDTQTLIALLTLSDFKTYKQFLVCYEGYTIEEFLEIILNK